MTREQAMRKRLADLGDQRFMGLPLTPERTQEITSDLALLLEVAGAAARCSDETLTNVTHTDWFALRDALAKLDEEVPDA